MSPRGCARARSGAEQPPSCGQGSGDIPRDIGQGWGTPGEGESQPYVHDVDGHGAGGGDEHDATLDVVVGREQTLGRQVDQDTRHHPDGEHGEQGPQNFCGESPPSPTLPLHCRAKPEHPPGPPPPGCIGAQGGHPAPIPGVAPCTGTAVPLPCPAHAHGAGALLGLPVPPRAPHAPQSFPRHPVPMERATWGALSVPWGPQEPEGSPRG